MERQWINAREIKNVDGALKPSAYIGRAYRYGKDHENVLPEWASKTDACQWRFARSYVEESARENLETLGIHEAAELLGASRKAVQNWVDEGLIPMAHADSHEKGTTRRIDRFGFEKLVPELKKRLTTPPVIGFKRKRGVPVPEPDEIAAIEQALESGKSSPARSAALALEERLQCARKRRKLEKDLASRESDSLARKSEHAAALEEQLARAKEERKQEEKWGADSTTIALRIMDDMFEDRITRIEAMKLYNGAVKSRDIPDGIRIRIRKDFFGR